MNCPGILSMIFQHGREALVELQDDFKYQNIKFIIKITSEVSALGQMDCVCSEVGPSASRVYCRLRAWIKNLMLYHQNHV